MLHGRTKLGLLLAMAIAMPLVLNATDTRAAEKEKPTGKEKATQGATRASGADIVAKSRTCTGDAPKIEKLKPDQGKPGTKITILGRNFGSQGCLTAVSFGPGNPAKFVQDDDGKVTATVPPGRRGLELLTVTTASGEDSKPFLVK